MALIEAELQTPVLDLHVAAKNFGNRTVIADVRLTLAPHEIVAVVGPSGCGKTSLLRIAAGLDTNFQGRLAWRDGTTPRIGMVFQEPRLLPWRSLRENLLLVAPDVDEVDRLLAVLGLGAFKDHTPRRVSLGMARRAAIARAFAIRPDLILLDEPFVSLDATMSQIAREAFLTAWRDRRAASILVTHDRAEAALLADRIVMLGGSPTRRIREVQVPAGLRGGAVEDAQRYANEALRDELTSGS